jgi:hypothetical protein
MIAGNAATSGSPASVGLRVGRDMELSRPEAAEMLKVSPDLLRERLQHARAAILAFTRYAAWCRTLRSVTCTRQVPAALRAGKVRADNCAFAASDISFQRSRAVVRQVDEARRAFAVHRSSQPRASPIDFARRLMETFESVVVPL